MIREIDFDNEKHLLLEVLHQSFLTVAREFGLTRENAPTNPAYVGIERLEDAVNNRVEFFVSIENDRMTGCVAIEPGRQEGEYYLERLGVLPDCRHRGIGERLAERALQEIGKRGGTSVGIGIIDGNHRLKKWYRAMGFEVTGTKRFDHLPFTVCFMKREVAS